MGANSIPYVVGNTGFALVVKGILGQRTGDRFVLTVPPRDCNPSVWSDMYCLSPPCLSGSPGEAYVAAFLRGLGLAPQVETFRRVTDTNCL